MESGESLMKQILVIDDDIHIGNILETALTADGYSVKRAYSGTEAAMLLESCRPDLILLDLMLPGLSGEEILPMLSGIPVIVISAKVDIDHKVDLLLDGADDYITKPFELKEVLARIQVQLRKAEIPDKNALLQYGDLQIDTHSRTVTVQSVPVWLTRTEYAILKILLQNPTQVIAKSVLLDRISMETPDCTERSLKQHISNLRKKLEEIGGRDYIETVWGIGFKLA